MQSIFWGIAQRASETGHSTQKLVAYKRRPIEDNLSPGQAVYELVSGSARSS